MHSAVDESSGSDFTNYFLAFPLEGVKQTMQEKKDGKLAREGVLELCHNWVRTLLRLFLSGYSCVCLGGKGSKSAS